jgi:hypothetical protein
MRMLLAATQEIAEWQPERQRIVRRRAARLAGAADVNPALMVKLPVEFKRHGHARRHGRDRQTGNGKPVPNC